MAGSTSPRAVRRLRAACEQAKRMLATGTTASTDLDSLVEFNGLAEIPNFRMGSIVWVEQQVSRISISNAISWNTSSMNPTPRMFVAATAS